MDIHLKIKELAREKNVSILKVIEASGMTESGYYQSIKRNSLGVAEFIKMIDFLGVSPTEFFGSKTPKFIEERLEDLEKSIESLTQELEEMKRKLDQ